MTTTMDPSPSVQVPASGYSPAAPEISPALIPDSDAPTGVSATGGAAAATPPDPIPSVPSPWELHGDVYFFAFWTSASQARKLPPMAYSPLEAGSEYASTSASRPAGGLSMVQIIRYRDSPVGPYDEFIIIPGSFDYVREDASGKAKRGRNPKISRIYVSQKHSCYNGRRNWNVPKHLARFDWVDHANGATSVKVYPHDNYSSSSPSLSTEAQPSPEPFFQATFKSMSYTPSFPFATSWSHILGIDTTLVLPPLPEGHGSQGELPGTDRWCSIVPYQYSRRTSIGWFDIAQRGDEGHVAGRYKNFWPGLGRWQVGMKMEDAVVLFNDADVWDRPRSHL